jgi:hypothetical protein
MKEKGSQGSNPANGQNPQMGNTESVSTTIVKDFPVKNYCERYVRVHSKRYRERLDISNVLRALLSAGEIVDEKRLEKLNPEYRFRGDFVKSMRRIHCSFPNETTMYLQNGVWHIAPGMVQV